MEYLLAHRGGRGQSFVYELVHEPGQPQFAGLINVYDVNFAGSGEGFAPGSRRQSGGIAAPSRPSEARMNIAPNGVFHAESEKRIDTGA